MEHIGKMLKQVLRNKNLSAEELGHLIGRSNPTVYDMFRREHIHPKLLEKISSALKHDMFQYLRTDENSAAEKKLQEKNTEQEKEIETLKKEIVFLKDVIQSFRKK